MSRMSELDIEIQETLEKIENERKLEIASEELDSVIESDD